MPKGNPPFKPRTTESVARGTIISLFLEVLDLTSSKEPRAWETVAIKFDEAADMARRVEAHLGRLDSQEEEAKALSEFLAPVFGQTRPQAPGRFRGTSRDIDPARVVFVPEPGSARGEALAAIIRGLTGGAPMTSLKNLLEAGDGLGKRLQVFRTLAAQARERGELSLDLPLAVLWEADDAEALGRWESAKCAALGQVPLFPGGDQ